MKRIYSWWLGFYEHVITENCYGRMWADEARNDAYDAGWWFANVVRNREVY